MEKTPESKYAYVSGEKQLIPIRFTHRASDRFFADFVRREPGFFLVFFPRPKEYPRGERHRRKA
jgi:hypothetical protein